MRDQKLAEMRWQRVKVQPFTRRSNPPGVVDDTWIPVPAGDEMNLYNCRTEHNIPLPAGAVRAFIPGKDGADGLLILDGQIVLFGLNDAAIENLSV
jgi:hypothetical protein